MGEGKWECLTLTQRSLTLETEEFLSPYGMIPRGQEVPDSKHP